jgi:polyphosphate glucokinase
MGKKKWRLYVAGIVEELQSALEADCVVLGGGNAKIIKTLPPKTRLGANGNAFIGGYRLWSTKLNTRNHFSIE